MINEVVVQGSKDTTFHDFSMLQVGMEIYISTGSYHQNGIEQVVNEDEISIEFDLPTEDTWYEIWLCYDKISILTKVSGDEFGEMINQIDKIAWFMIPANATTLDGVEINIIRMVEFG